MTIRFLTGWNGYVAGDIATLSNEAELIAGRIARKSNIIDGPNSGAPEAAGIRYLENGRASGIYSRRGSTIQMHPTVQRRALRIFDARMAATHTVPAGGESFHAVFRCAAPPLRVWAILANGSTTVTIGAGVRAAILDNDGLDLNGSGKAWPALSNGASAAVTVPVAPDPSRPSFAMTGYADLDNTTGSTLVGVRAFISTPAVYTICGRGVDGVDANLTNWATRKDNEVVFRNQLGDQITVPGGFTSTTNVSYTPIIGIAYLSHKNVVTVMSIGDSIEAGQGEYINSGPVYEAIRVGGGFDNIEVASLSYSGRSSLNSALAFDDAIAAGLIPNAVVYGMSPNDVGASLVVTDTIVKDWRIRMMSFKQACVNNNIISIPRTMVPTNSPIDTPVGIHYNWGSSDKKRVDFNNEIINSNSITLDYARAVEGVLNANGQIPFAAGMTTDTLHPNNAGNLAIAAAIRAKIPRFITP